MYAYSKRILWWYSFISCWAVPETDERPGFECDLLYELNSRLAGREGKTSQGTLICRFPFGVTGAGVCYARGQCKVRSPGHSTCRQGAAGTHAPIGL